MTEQNYTAPDLALVGADHIAAYRETGGEVGYLWNGVPTLLLTQPGGSSGIVHTSALIFARDGDDYLSWRRWAALPGTRRGTSTCRPTGGRDSGEGASGSR